MSSATNCSKHTSTNSNYWHAEGITAHTIEIRGALYPVQEPVAELIDRISIEAERLREENKELVMSSTAMGKIINALVSERSQLIAEAQDHDEIFIKSIEALNRAGLDAENERQIPGVIDDLREENQRLWAENERLRKGGV